MGGSSGQVVGYRYFTNFLLFIGNPIENLIAINFDKRGWMTGERVPMGDNGSLIYLEAPNLYGENEGGVSGTLNLKLGTNIQTEDKVYKNYMESIGLQASAYPYQSYISFTGGGLSNSLENLTEEQLQELADQYNNGIIPGRGFYVGNSGYMKEMLLWPKRIHVRNDGREQWYDEKAEISYKYEYEISQEYLYKGPFYLEAKAVVSSAGGTNEITENNYTYTGNFKQSDTFGAVWSIGGQIENIEPHDPLSFEAIYLVPSLGFIAEVYFTISRKGVLSQNVEYSVVGVVVEPIVVTNGENSTYISAKFLIPKGVGKTLIGLKGVADGIVFGSGSPQLGAQIITNMHRCYKLKSFVDYGGEDINPIHKIREILTDDTAMNKPETSVNDVNFIKAADRIWNEGLGISWSITEKSCIDAINELCYHIEAGIRVNRQTCLYEMVLFRDDWFNEDEIHTISESKIKSMQYEITNADEVINQVNVNYYDRANIKNSSFSISESGLIQTLNQVNAETLDFPYFMNMRNAEIVANWKLKQLSTGAFKGSFTTGWREARKWNRYDLIRLPWSKRWTGTILVRIMSINLGSPTNNEVTIEFIEVVPSTGMMNTSIVIDDAIDTKPEVPKPCNAKVFELSYYEAVQTFGERNVDTELTDNAEVGYLCTVAEKPQNNSLNAALHADSGNGFERVATVNYCETAYLDQAIDRMSNTFVVKNTGNITSVRVGSQIFINDEIMVYQSYDAETKVLTVKRGALDSIPQDHSIDSILYFADDFVAVDQTLYVEGEIINAKVLTTTPGGVLALADAENYEVEFKARAIRPYPPANVKINGEYFQQEIEADLILTWVDRNRIQQTGGEILGWYEPGVMLESGVNYQLILTELDEYEVELRTQNINVGIVNMYTLQTASVQSNTRSIIVTLKSIRDGFECLNPFTHTVELSTFFSAPYNINYTVSDL